MITNTIINQLKEENNMAEARNIMDELKDQFFQDALTLKREYSGN
jgi:hypothetical protein